MSMSRQECLLHLFKIVDEVFLEHGLAWMRKTAIGCQDVNLGADLLTGRDVNNMPSQDAHGKLPEWMRTRWGDCLVK